MAKKIKKNSERLLAVFLSITVLGMFLIYYKNTQAASLTGMSDTMNRLKASEESNHDIRFRTPTGMSSGTITLNLGTSAGFTNATNGSVTFDDIDLQYGSSQSEVNGSCASNCAQATLAAAAGAGSWGASFDGSIDLTLTYPTSGGTAIAANDYVRIIIGTNAATGGAGVQQLNNAASTGVKTFTIAAGSDSGKVALSILSDEQVVVSTSIDPYLTFTVGQNTVSLTKSGGGNPDYNNTGYNQGTANTLAANTNGTSGYTISYNGTTLTSGGNSIDAMATKTTSSTNTEQFGINLKNNATPDTGAEPTGGSGTVSSDYNTVDQYRFIADTTTPLASASAATTTTTYTVSYITNVGQTTEAGDYSTTITYICTGNF